MNLKVKLILTFLAVLLIPSITIGVIHSYQAKEQLTEVTKKAMANEANVAVELISFLNKKVEDGTISKEEAQEEVKQLFVGTKNEDETRLINQNFNFGEHGYYFVMDEQANLLAHPMREGQNLYEIEGMNSADFVPTLISHAKQPNGGFTYYDWELPASNATDKVNAQGLNTWDIPVSNLTDHISPKITYTIQEPHWGWVIGVSAYLYEFNSPAVEILLSTILSIVTFTFLGVIIINYIATRITKPILELKNSMQKISKGEFDISQLNTSRKDEIGLINRTYVDMASSVSTFLSGLRKEVDSIMVHHPKQVKDKSNQTETKQLSAFISEISDIQQRTEERLRLSAKVFDNTLEGIAITDTNGDIIFVNPAFTALTGYKPEEAIGENPRILQSGKHDSQFYKEMWLSLADKDQWKGEIWNKRKDGTIFPQWLTISAIKNEAGETTHYAAVFIDITEQKNQIKMIEHQAYHDSLTGLPNRRLFNKRLSGSIEVAKENNEQIAIMFLDLDRFKNINDSLGHEFGDHLLKKIGDILVGMLGNDVTISRIGGDEFIILFPYIKSKNEVEEMAQRIIDTVNRVVNIKGYEVVITTSIGVSMYPRDGDNLDELIKNADTALYHVKDKGRNGFCFYEAYMSEKVLKRMKLEGNLRQALANDEFLVFYQPKVDIKGGNIVGMEALIRWQHPVTGMVSPGDFIPIAEETGLIMPIGEWVLYTACQQNKAWQDAGYSPMRVSVNIAAQQFQKDYLVTLVKDVLKKTDLEAQYLELEITEGSIMNNTEEAIEIVNELKNIGVMISIDDFGTGYSSLNYLKRFAIDTIKIDQSFVRNIMFDESDAAIVKAIISMAHSLNKEVIAEGVETEAQLSYLRNQGCQEIQGYLFSGPVPAIAFEKIIEEEETFQRMSKCI